MAALTEDELPFICAILGAPKDLTTRLVYADWLEERGDSRRAEYLRLWVRHYGTEQTPDVDPQLVEYMRGLVAPGRVRWAGLISVWKPRDDPPATGHRGYTGRPTDADLGYGPCHLCGRKNPRDEYVSRMPCERCSRVFCWQCADTGVYGSLPDFRHFVTGVWSRPGFRLGSDSCPFCQTTDWMSAHGG